MTPIRALGGDEHTLVRAGVRGLLQGLQGVEVVGEPGDGQEAQRRPEAFRPNVVLLDVGMPGLNGSEVVRDNSSNHGGEGEAWRIGSR